MKKRIMLALVVALVMFGVVYASAASLGVSGGIIQAGSDGDLRCDLDGVTVLGWGLEVDDNSVRSFRLGGVDAACNGATMFATINRADGSTRTAGSVELNGATTYTFRFNAPYPTPAEIVGVNIFIEGEDPVSVP